MQNKNYAKSWSAKHLTEINHFKLHFSSCEQTKQLFNARKAYSELASRAFSYVVVKSGRRRQKEFFRVETAEFRKRPNIPPELLTYHIKRDRIIAVSHD